MIEVLELASRLTNHPAYEAAVKAMRLHRLDRGGLRRALHDLQRRHGHIEPHDYAQPIVLYMTELDYSYRQAIEHVVASMGIPGHSFSDAVEKVRKAYPKGDLRKKQREQELYLEELHQGRLRK